MQYWTIITKDEKALGPYTQFPTAQYRLDQLRDRGDFTAKIIPMTPDTAACGKPVGNRRSR